MRRLLLVLMLLSLLLSLMSFPALAQDDPGADAQPPQSNAFLPLIADGADSAEAQDVAANPEQEPASAPATPEDTPPPPTGDWGNNKHGRVSPAERQAAAARAAALGLEPATVTGEVPVGAMGGSPHYYGPYPNYANSPLPEVTGAITGGIRKFMSSLPGLGPTGANNLGQYIPVAVADTTSYPGSDYYELAIVQYREQMHPDLPATLLRGYVQLETAENAGVSKHVALVNESMEGAPTPILIDGNPVYAVDTPHYLGPAISATKDRPVRILFRNLLPTGQDGDLFVPVDTTVMGSGMGPEMGDAAVMDPQNPACGESPKPRGCYTENRAVLHLHGGITPWISDGTPHQWITPAGEDTPYPRGVSVQNVPDMPDPGPGAVTLFYTNQQSARLLWYHDHAWGITRLNVYVGGAGPYLLTDNAEQKLKQDGVVPADEIPLVLQDKTFVPDPAQLATEDPTWDTARWGGKGNLWLPHVYVPAQNPGDASGVNAFGRWAYGPWFWPPTINLQYGPMPNPYYDAGCNPDTTWCEPPQIPGVPNLSMGMESYHDTPMINGAAYPTMTVEPKAYRFRILNAANDRFFNLSLYKAVDANGAPCDPTNVAPAPEASGVACTEVALNPDEVNAALTDPAGSFPTPNTTLSTPGPDWIQIGTEGGFLPAPAVIPPQHITWVTDPTVFNAGNVDQHSLLLGPGERADVIVDFAKFAGQTLILYNDAPAAFPARDPRYDYYTGNADLRTSGGAPSTIAGYGPNTRTMMQIKVAASAPAPDFDLAKLEAAFVHHADGSGVFESSQHPIIVGQSPYNSAYGSSFPSNGPLAGLVQIFNTALTFSTLSNNQLTMPLAPKQIQDEMGEAFDPEYGRMSGFLGVEAPNANALAQNMILYPYVNPASEIVNALDVPFGVEAQPISTTDDGTQIWKITHNGVDTHPIHFHLFDVQLINRVGWDGIIRRPDANELGWKDTVRISPLEDTTVALRPIMPKAPFGLPDSIRPLNPMMPLGATGGFNNVDTNGNPIVPGIVNQIVNFGWEYVWHCHILSHEEMDMMRPIILNALKSLPAKPNPVTADASLPAPGQSQVALTWQDPTPPIPANWGNPANEIGFKIERSASRGPYTLIYTAGANQTAYVDRTVGSDTTYRYRVTTFNAAGSAVSDAVTVQTGVDVKPPTPSNLAATVQNGNQLRVTWNRTSGATAYVLTRTGGNTAVPPVTLNGNNTTSYTDNRSIVLGMSFTYELVAVNGNVNPPVQSDPATVTIAVPFPVPTNLRVTNRTVNSISLSWNNVQAGQPVRYEIWRSLNGTDWAPVAPAASLSTTNFTDTGLTTATTYWYLIRAFTTSSPPLVSAWSSPVNARTR